MQIFVDHFYDKGHGHEVCQDYALSTQNKDYAFFVVSDGCGSAPNSEIGSIIMANALKSSVETLWYREKPMDITKRGSVQKIAITKANEAARALELNPESLYATLLLGFYDKQTKEFAMAAWGDGAFAILYDDGHCDIHSIGYEGNAPFYMMYADGGMESYIQNCGGSANVHFVELRREGHFEGYAHRYIKSPSVIKISPRKGKKIKGIFGFSDGIESCGKMSHLDVVSKCLDLKNINGTFIRRRGKRILKQFEQEGYSPYDDFSFAGIIIK